MFRLALHSRPDLSEATLDVVIVDPDAAFLDGLRRTLHRDRRRWNVAFVPDAKQALKALKKGKIDVVLSGLPVDGDAGTDVLEVARELSPSTARIQLTGGHDPDALVHASRVAHQVIAKDCEFEEIRSTIERLASSRDELVEDRLRALVNDVQVLPTPSDVQRQLTEVLGRPHTLGDVAEVVETDVALTAELLRLVNSSFFGLARRVETVRDSVSMLGLELVEATVASRSAFSGADDLPIDAAEVNRHSQAVATVAGLVAAGGGISRQDRSLAVSAGLLHDVGVLILAQVDPQGSDSGADVLAVDDLDAERLAFGADRFTVGAHLLDLWAFSARTPQAIREMCAGTRELGVGTVGWTLRLAHHAVTKHDVGLPDAADDREWYDRMNEIERELLVAE